MNATSEAPAKSNRGERSAAIVALGLPFLYLLTERTRDVFLWRWSKPWCVSIAIYGALFALWIASYRRALPSYVEISRKLAVVMIVSTLAALVVLELVLRATTHHAFEELDNRGRHVFDPDVGHVYAPNFHGVIQEHEFKTEWQTNAQALRAEHDYGPKAPDTKRILVVGDSFTAGDQVVYRETFPAVIESCLGAKLAGEKLEVLDAGHPGYSTCSEARWIAKFAKSFEPDLVIVAMTPNDLLENQFPLVYIARDGALVSGTATDADEARWKDHQGWWSLPGLVEHSLVLQRVENSPAYKRWRTGSAFTHFRSFQVKRDDKAQKLWKLAEQYVVDAKRATDAIGAKFALITIPFREQLAPLEPNLDGRIFGKSWEDFGAANGFAALDLEPAFAAASDVASLYWREDSHCTAAGYRLIGETTCAWLAAKAKELGL